VDKSIRVLWVSEILLSGLNLFYPFGEGFHPWIEKKDQIGYVEPFRKYLITRDQRSEEAK